METSPLRQDLHKGLRGGNDRLFRSHKIRKSNQGIIMKTLLIIIWAIVFIVVIKGVLQTILNHRNNERKS